MADIFERFIPSGVQGAAGNITTSRTTLYTVPASSKIVIRHMGFINTTSAAITVQLWMHGTQYEMGLVIPPNDSRALDISEWVLNTGELIEAQATAVGVNMVVHGVREV